MSRSIHKWQYRRYINRVIEASTGLSFTSTSNYRPPSPPPAQIMECYSRHFTTSSLYSPTNIFRDWFNEKWPTSPLLPFVGLDDDGSNFFGYSEDSLSPSPLLSSSSPSISDVGTPTMCPNWSCLDTPQNVDAKPPAFPIEFPHFSPTGHIIDHAALKAAQHEV
jgi:hypothetical protein